MRVWQKVALGTALWCAVLYVLTFHWHVFSAPQYSPHASPNAAASIFAASASDPLPLGQGLRGGAAAADGAALPPQQPQEQVATAAASFKISHLHSPVREEPEVKAPDTAPVAPSMEETKAHLLKYLKLLHQRWTAIPTQQLTPDRIWNEYFVTTRDELVAWDDKYKHVQPKTRDDRSIFVSVASYRDKYCPETLASLYSHAYDKTKVFVGIVQQNCVEHCRTGVLDGGKVEDAGPDIDCYDAFCQTDVGKPICAANDDRLRVLRIDEPESLGPYMGRYFGAKLHKGENYYLQIDSHSYFDTDWDTKLIEMVEKAPSAKAVISGYPPPHNMRWQGTVGYRMCDCIFATSDIESEIIRLDPSAPYDHVKSDIPHYAPFVAAGFLFSNSDVLQEVPFDPFLPYIFMGEEISMSARLWTNGWDIFSPTVNVLSHIYVRRHLPKFWETVNRLFRKQVFNPTSMLIIKRVKNLVGYPESATELISPPSILYRLEDFGLGTVRPMKDYLAMVGIDPVQKRIVKPKWCHEGSTPHPVL